MSLPREVPPSSVPATATQGGDVRERWLWTEPAVWTERVLTALEQGVKGGVWFSLMDKVYSEDNLFAAYCQVAANDGAPGVDHITTEEFGRDLDTNLKKLAELVKGDDATVVFLPHAGRSYELALRGAGSVKARSDFDRILKSLRVS